MTKPSPFLDEAASIFDEWQRAGAGGRYCQRHGQFFDADTKAVFLVVREF